MSIRSIEITQNGISYRRAGSNWYIEMFGTVSQSPNTPRYRWHEVKEENIPHEVRNKVKKIINEA